MENQDVLTCRSRIAWVAFIIRVGVLDEGVSQEGLCQSGRQVNGFKPLAKTDASSGCGVRGGGRGWRRWLEGRPGRQGKVIGGFYSRSRRSKRSWDRGRSSGCKVGGVDII